MAATLITVRVRAGARRESIEKEGDEYRVSVKEKAQGGMANDRVRALIAETFSVALSRVKIVTGHRSPTKKIEVRAAK